MFIDGVIKLNSWSLNWVKDLLFFFFRKSFYLISYFKVVVECDNDFYVKFVLSLISEESLVRYWVWEIINSFENNFRLFWFGF